MNSVEYATKLFVVGMYYWFADDETAARQCVDMALDAYNSVAFVGDA